MQIVAIVFLAFVEALLITLWVRRRDERQEDAFRLKQRTEMDVAESTFRTMVAAAQAKTAEAESKVDELTGVVANLQRIIDTPIRITMEKLSVSALVPDYVISSAANIDDLFRVRVESMVRDLEHAAEKGLQVIWTETTISERDEAGGKVITASVGVFPRFGRFGSEVIIQGHKVIVEEGEEREIAASMGLHWR